VSFLLLSVGVSVSCRGVKLFFPIIIFTNGFIEGHLAGCLPLLLNLVVHIFKVLNKLLILAPDVLSLLQEGLITQHLQTFLALIQDVHHLISLIKLLELSDPLG
jgi:hypothetical protein